MLHIVRIKLKTRHNIILNPRILSSSLLRIPMPPVQNPRNRSHVSPLKQHLPSPSRSPKHRNGNLTSHVFRRSRSGNQLLIKTTRIQYAKNQPRPIKHNLRRRTRTQHRQPRTSRLDPIRSTKIRIQRRPNLLGRPGHRHSRMQRHIIMANFIRPPSHN